MLADEQGTLLHNPVLPGAVVGGGCAGAAVLIGAHADVALAVDAGGELRVCWFDCCWVKPIDMLNRCLLRVVACFAFAPLLEPCLRTAQGR